MNEIKVSVIVPVYNVEEWLSRCLDSLVNQTLKDIEIICVNDCSPDKSLTVLKEYAAKDSRIKIIDFEKNQGVSAARNCGIEIAKGEYIGLCDPDDYVDLDFYEKLYDKAKETNADVVKSSLKKKEPHQAKEYSFSANIKNSKYNNKFFHWCYIYKTTFLKKYSINYPKGIRFAEDTLFLIKSLFYANKIEIAESVYYHYIMRKNGAATSCLGEAVVNSYGMPLVFDFMNKEANNKNEYKDFFENIFSSVIYFYSFVEQEYKKTFAGIMIDIYKRRKYSIAIENFSNFLKESDFENADILYEKLNSFQYLFQYPKIQIDNLQNRKLYIWGAGANGLDALIQCDCNDWKVEAFLDSNIQLKDFQGYKVLQPQDLLISASRDYFIVISSKNYASEIARTCEQAGLKEGLNFWKPI